MINRFSSRRQRLDSDFLCKKLARAVSYKRIAGYFRSSIFELVGEEIGNIDSVKILCNSDLDPADISVSKTARDMALKEKWNQVAVDTEALLHRERYKRLFDLLTSGRVEIRVVPRENTFVHGKAGVIEGPDGTKTCFLGSINETKNAFAKNYEILWEDTSEEGVQWVEEEFEELWAESYPLPDAIIEEIKRVGERIEVRFDDLDDKDLPAAAIVETPIYRGGEQLQPWQRSFLAMFMQHRETFGCSRLLLADEVGLGKTLSLAGSAMVSALLNDGPVLIVCPSTITFQWQSEMKDLLGIPSAVWLSNRKIWVDADGHFIKTHSPRDVTRCPFKIAIISTGLIFHDSEERDALLGCRFGTVILDEAHKARRKGGLGHQKDQPNNLLDFMLQIGCRTKNLLLGTATPIQTEVFELWDLLKVLNNGAGFVLGDKFSIWMDYERVLPYIKGDKPPPDAKEAWELLRNPLPPRNEGDWIVPAIRNSMSIEDRDFRCATALGDLDWVSQDAIYASLDADYFRLFNPLVRHIVLRKRSTLEELGLLDRIEVKIHPDPEPAVGAYTGATFIGKGLMVSRPFEMAYEAAENFAESLGKRTRSAGFIKTMLLQRICSSFSSGKLTAERMLRREILDDEDEIQALKQALENLTPEEASYLMQIVSELSRPEARDPKLAAIKYFLTDHKSEGKSWLEHGCIIFSQYFDTALWVAAELAKSINGEPVAVYAGVGKSAIFKGQQNILAEREEIKRSIKKREIRLVVATDAACEGLNLQTLGTLINIDLPWNPSRLEQRLGRIKRFGQTRRTVDMLNLVYHETQDEDIYDVLSRRLKDKFDIFGSLPDTIEDDWIEDIEQLESRMDQYMHLRNQAKNAFEIKYQDTIDPKQNRWELCAQVLSRRDIIEKLSESW